MALVKKSLRRTLSRLSLIAGIGALFFSGAPLHHQLDREAASVFHTQHAHADTPHSDCLITCSGGADGSGGSCIGANCTGCMGPDAASDLGGGSSGGSADSGGDGSDGGSDGGCTCW